MARNVFDMIGEALRKGEGVHDAIAGAMASGILRCAKCGAVRDLTRLDVKRFVANGWPECCGHTMGYYTGIDAEHMARKAS